jgi:hypothetical protein
MARRNTRADSRPFVSIVVILMPILSTQLYMHAMGGHHA